MAESPTSAPPGAVGERTTYEEFLRCYEGESAEWVDGWVYPMSPVGREHQRIGLFLASLLQEWAEARQAGEVFYEKFQMRLPTAGREPDVLFVRSEHLDRLAETYLDGPADLAIEIVSAESKGRDRGEKYFEYERGGVQEYWLIDPERQVAEFYQLQADGLFRVAEPESGIYRSRELNGFWLRVDWLWERPAVADAAAELGLR